MSYGRLTIVTPRSGEEGTAAQNLEELAGFYRQQEGCVSRYVLRHPPEGSAYKLGIWRDEHTADSAANLDRSLSLRGRVLEVAEAQPEELALEATDSGGPA